MQINFVQVNLNMSALSVLGYKHVL